MATALIAVPLFLALSFFITHLNGDEKASHLQNRIRNDQLLIDGLSAENANLNERLSEMWAFKRDSERKSSIIRELEEELDVAREQSCPAQAEQFGLNKDGKPKPDASGS